MFCPGLQNSSLLWCSLQNQSHILLVLLPFHVGPAADVFLLSQRVQYSATHYSPEPPWRSVFFPDRTPAAGSGGQRLPSWVSREFGLIHSKSPMPEHPPPTRRPHPSAAFHTEVIKSRTHNHFRTLELVGETPTFLCTLGCHIHAHNSLATATRMATEVIQGRRN